MDAFVRYYDPVAARFLSEDPVITDQNTGASFNRYVYASNNPYKYIDPDGRSDVCAGLSRMNCGTIIDNTDGTNSTSTAGTKKGGKKVDTQDNPHAQGGIYEVDQMGNPVSPNYPGVGAAQVVAGGVYIAGTATVLSAAAVGSDATVMVGQGLFRTTEHFAIRMAQRGISLSMVETTLARAVPTAYFHAGIWKLGFYNPQTRILVTTVSGRITTVMKTGERYVRNLFGNP